MGKIAMAHFERRGLQLLGDPGLVRAPCLAVLAAAPERFQRSTSS